jgi:hypothetical protein
MYAYMWVQISDPRKGSWSGEIVHRRKNGEEVPVLLTITPIRLVGEIAGYMGIGIDLSERKRAEEMKELYDMVVRHDLEVAPLAVIFLLQALRDGWRGR